MSLLSPLQLPLESQQEMTTSITCVEIDQHKHREKKKFSLTSSMCVHLIPGYD